MGHFAVTDVMNNRFYAFERFSRDGSGLAGAAVAEAQGFRIWLEDWSVDGEGATQPRCERPARLRDN
jgi:predicted secreted hydrolase